MDHHELNTQLSLITCIWIIKKHKNTLGYDFALSFKYVPREHVKIKTNGKYIYNKESYYIEDKKYKSWAVCYPSLELALKAFKQKTAEVAEAELEMAKIKLEVAKHHADGHKQYIREHEKLLQI